MEKKLRNGIIAVALVTIALFVGCVEKEEIPEAVLTPIPESTSLPTPTPIVTSSPAATAKPTPTPEPKYSRGDIIDRSAGFEGKDQARLILSYENTTDTYQVVTVNKVSYKWTYYKDEDCVDREREELVNPYKIGYINPSKLKTYEAYQKSRTWHTVDSFTRSPSFSGVKHTTTSSFTIKGEEWRVKYTTSSRQRVIFEVWVYPEDETVGSLAHWSCDRIPCSGTEYIYSGKGEYYFEVFTENIDTWKLIVEDYY